MKKFALLLCLVIPLYLTSCGSKDDEPETSELDGTVWSQTVGDHIYTFYFALNGNLTYEDKMTGFDTVRFYNKYSYAKPNVTFKSISGSVIGSGTVTGEQMNIDYSEKTYTLTRIR